MARQKERVIPGALLDRLLGGADAKSVFDGGGRIEPLTAALAERALNAERDPPLLSEGSSGNRRNGFGLWIETSEGAKFWLRGMNELKNRRVEDILIAAVDGPKGFSDAIDALLPQRGNSQESGNSDDLKPLTNPEMSPRSALFTADYSSRTTPNSIKERNRLKHLRRSATRYDRRTIHFNALIHLAAAMIWLT